jgi:hypothetical protein
MLSKGEGGMFAAAALVVAVILFIKFPAFRKLTLVAVAVGTVGVVLFLAYYHEQEEEKVRNREAAKHLVAPKSLDFEDMRLGKGYGDNFHLTGRVNNNSQFTITAITVKVSISDCDSSGHCDVVGDKQEESYLRIPPGQARDLNENLFMDQGTEIRNTMQWNYSIPDVSAEQ